MLKEDIRLGMRVMDKNLLVTYTWIKSYGSVCSMCGFPSPLFLWENEPIINTFGDSYRGKYCVDCAGVEDLVPLFTVV
jgi:hypothetical protein